MEAQNVIKQLDKHRIKNEAGFVMCLWNEPELYEEYLKLNEGRDKTIRSEDAKFYFRIGKEMYKQGFRTFDHITVDTFLDGNTADKETFEGHGGYRGIQEMMSLVDPTNIDGYFDKVTKINMLSELSTAYESAFDDLDQFDDMTSEDVYSYFEGINSEASIKSGNSEQVENLNIDDEFIDRLNSGEQMGYQYRKFCPSLNYLTLGAKPGSMYMIGALSGVGKTAFGFGAILMSAHYSGNKVAVISNEMTIEDYKLLLLIHVLINDLNYYGINRKQLRTGNYSPEQMSKVHEAQKIIEEKYNDVYFVKMFDNNIEKIMKFMRKLKALGVTVVLYDTFKSDDRARADVLWQSLMLDARRLFHCVSRLDICCITTYQLALHTENTRYLTASCLSNSKQIKEIYDTIIYMRNMWSDEKPGEQYDVHTFKYNKKEASGKENISLNREDKHMLVFVDKNRNDEDKQVLVYKWQPSWNKWEELGYGTVINDHGMGS